MRAPLAYVPSSTCERLPLLRRYPSNRTPALPPHPDPPADEAQKPGADLDDSDPDLDYMLNDTKRKKLGLGAGGGRKRSRRGGGGSKKAAADDDVVDLASDDDSDKQLLRQAGADARRSTAASLPPAPAPRAATRSGGRREAALDPKAAAMLQQLYNTNARLKALQEEGLSDDESEEQPGGCWCGCRRKLC